MVNMLMSSGLPNGFIEAVYDPIAEAYKDTREKYAIEEWASLGAVERLARVMMATNTVS